MADRTVLIVTDTGHSSEITIPEEAADGTTMQFGLAVALWVEVERLLAIPEPETTVSIEVGDG